MTRGEYIASFILHGWEPWSAIHRGKPTKETVLVHGDTLQRACRRVPGEDYATYNGAAKAPTRVLRGWNSLTLPSLRMMHNRMLYRELYGPEPSTMTRSKTYGHSQRRFSMNGEANMSKISTLILAGYRPYQPMSMFVPDGTPTGRRRIDHYRIVPEAGHPARMIVLYYDPKEGHAMLTTALNPELQGWLPIEWSQIPFGAWVGLHPNLLKTLMDECDEARRG